MSKKQWMVLLMLFLTYLLLGASIFYHIESRLEIEKVAKAREERIEINALLQEHYVTKETEGQHEILERLTRYCGKSVKNYTEDETDPLKWDFYNSFYFAYTVVSTIGYGNLAPTTMLSRILMMFYGVVGIPMNGILLSQLGEFFGLVFVRAHKKYKSYKHSQSEYAKKLTPLETRKAGLAAQIFMYLIPGFVMFIFFPAFLFSHYEGWAYDEAVYYAFVTLTTIGFGDYVAGQDNTKGSGVLFILYKTFLIAWISFGLGYIVMIMTFIARGMRSKKITRLEHKLAMNLKHTQSKIWNEFNKEVGYLRRVFNELQLSKVKRIYVDEYDYEAPPCKFQRSNSFPDLRDLVYGGLANPQPSHPRRRANSEVAPMEVPVARVVSETDLQRIDKNATFATHAMVQPAELLARLVNVLGYIPPPPDDDQDEIPSSEATRSGVQGFSDREILANERGWNNSTWKLGGGSEKSGDPVTRKPRSRAASEIRLDPMYEPQQQQRNVEWTWSGPSASRKIQELIKARRNGAAAAAAAAAAASTNGKDAKCKFPNLALPKSVPKALLPRWIKQFSSKREGGAQRARNSMSVGDLDGENYLTQPSGGFRGAAGQPGGYSAGGGYESEDPASRAYFTHTGAADLASSLEGSNLLEETSLADFLRALTALHTRVGAVPDEFVMRKPQRKMGTACLTPPKLPSLLTLFSPPSGIASATQSQQNTVTATATSYNAGRRFSLRTAENSGTTTPNYRRNSVAHQVGVKPRRRFSLRPVATAQNGTPYLSGVPRHVKDPSTPPSPPPYNSEGFVVECPKESLVEKEGAPGVSTPITATTGIRRISLRPTTVQPEIYQPASQNPSPLTKGMPRWRAGMLQRQINQMNLQRRVRAFSLSDVNTEGSRASERNAAAATPALSPLVDGVRILEPKSTSQKTVTIVSPSAEELAALRTSSDSKQSSAAGRTNTDSVIPRPQVDQQPQQQPQQQTSGTPSSSLQKTRSRVPYVRAISAIGNPFAYVDEERPPISTNPFVYQSTRKPTSNDAFATSSGGGISGRFAGKTESIGGESASQSGDNKDAKPEDPSSRTVYQALQSVRNIEAASGKSEATMTRPQEEKHLSSKAEAVKKSSDSSCSTVETDSRGASSRKVSAVSIGPWTESRKPSSRKVSTISQQSSESASDSRKSSTNKSPGDRPRVSIDSYKPLMEVKIEKPTENPFERYRATMRLSTGDADSLTEVKVETPEAGGFSEAERKFSTKLGRGPRESHS